MPVIACIPLPSARHCKETLARFEKCWFNILITLVFAKQKNLNLIFCNFTSHK